MYNLNWRHKFFFNLKSKRSFIISLVIISYRCVIEFIFDSVRKIVNKRKMNHCRKSKTLLGWKDRTQDSYADDAKKTDLNQETSQNSIK